MRSFVSHANVFLRILVLSGGLSIFNPSQLLAAENPFHVLGISPTGDRNEIHKAYLNLVKKLHPDRNHDVSDEMMEQLKKANRAWDFLKDEKKRAAYLRGEIDADGKPIYSRNKSTTQQRSSTTNAASENSKDILRKRQKYEWKKIYEQAKLSQKKGGLGFSEITAQEFADLLIEKSDSLAYFDRFMRAYVYSLQQLGGNGGFQRSVLSAQAMAHRLCNLYKTKDELEAYIREKENERKAQTAAAKKAEEQDQANEAKAREVDAQRRLEKERLARENAEKEKKSEQEKRMAEQELRARRAEAEAQQANANAIVAKSRYRQDPSIRSAADSSTNRTLNFKANTVQMDASILEGQNNLVRPPINHKDCVMYYGSMARGRK